MDKIHELKEEAKCSVDPTLDTSSSPSEAFLTANESSSKFFSLSEEDSTLIVSPTKDLTNSTVDNSIGQANLLSNLSPIPKNSDLENFKIGKQIEAANILSGGVNIFDDNSYDGDELVIDDNAIVEEKDAKVDEGQTNVVLDKIAENFETSDVCEATPSKDTEVVLQIDGKNVDAIDIGNGLYLYRKTGEEELAAVQIIDDDQQQPSFKFLKVRENAEGNLEVYEEIEIEVPKEIPAKDENLTKNKSKSPIQETCIAVTKNEDLETNASQDVINEKEKREQEKSLKDQESKLKSQTEPNLTGKNMKFSDSRKSPVISTFTQMTYHSTPNKEGIPLTKTMVNQHLQPNRHSDNIKKTIEVHTDNSKQKVLEANQIKSKDENDDKEGVIENNINVRTNEDITKNIENDKPCSLKQSEKTLIDSNIQTTLHQGTTSAILDGNLSNDEETKKNSENEQTDTELAIKKYEQNSKIQLTGKNDNNVIKKDIEIGKNFPNDISKVEAQILDNIDTDNDDKLIIVEDISVTPKDDLNTETNSVETCDMKTEGIEKDIEKPIVPKTGHAANLFDKTDLVESKENQSVASVKLLDSEKVNELQIEPLVNVHSNSQQSQNKETKDIPGNPVITGNNEEPSGLKENIDEIQKDIKTTSNELLNPDNSLETFVNTDTLDKGLTSQDLHTSSDETDKEIKTHMETSIKLSNNDNNRKSANDILNLASISKQSQNINMCDKPHIETKALPAQSPHNHTEPIVVKSMSNLASSSNLSNKTVLGTQKEMKSIYSKPLYDTKSLSHNVKIKQNADPIRCDVRKERVYDGKVNVFQDKEKILPGNNTVNPAEFKIFSREKILQESISKECDSKSKKSLKINSGDLKDIKASIPKEKSAPSKVTPAVPFGKWTEANRQEFLNKIKESKISAPNNSNTKQIKQPNDLNRRDVLKKIDSQRQNSSMAVIKSQDLNFSHKTTLHTSTAFKNSSSSTEQVLAVNLLKDPQKEKLNVNNDQKILTDADIIKNKPDTSVTIQLTNKALRRKEINNQDLIDKTIEGIINRALPQKNLQDDLNVKESSGKSYLDTLDDIERKMNELHGIPFVERPPHELPALESKGSEHNKDIKVDEESSSKMIKDKKNDLTAGKSNVCEKSNVSDEEILEHEPITGDIADVNKEKCNHNESESRKDSIITEKDFDKFARRNSVTYENCITVNFDGRETHNLIQSVMPKDTVNKKMSRNELMLAESKAKSAQKHQSIRQYSHISKIPAAVKPVNQDQINKPYQSKVQIAYNSAITAKHQNCPESIIEDKPVKVVFMDTTMNFTPLQLNVQGQEVSPTKKVISENLHSASESLDSDIMDNMKEHANKPKSRHQRKQVLTPVETPDLELIEPNDLSVETSPKKKRKVENKSDNKHKPKTLVPKKSYLLNRTIEDEKQSNDSKLSDKNPHNDSYVANSGTISAIDNLVKAAELLECQSKSISIEKVNTDTPQNTPPKRGRGRPRKYPLPGAETNPTPPSKIRDTYKYKNSTETEDSSDEEIIKENWTMGKINENIVCPICNKLFRSENVVFKHVKHCTGPSPNRSDTENRRSRRIRNSEDTKSNKSITYSKSDYSSSDEEKVAPKKHKSRDIKVQKETSVDKIKEDAVGDVDTQKSQKNKTNNLVCELCGKSFRQLSYLFHHKLQHKQEQISSNDNPNKDVFICEICKKEFRKLHHLVQHRIIHNPSAMSSRLSRKTSSENHEAKSTKPATQVNQIKELNAGFRCEPCDKSFRKLHHLVEHRETHDGINKKNCPQNLSDSSKSSTTHECDVCRKTFRKLQHLMEHKDHHLETSSEKSDDKSVQSCLSTKDIIHECSLCYMVFPNEHSLMKHTIICQRKKKQSALKLAKKSEEQLSTKEGNDDQEIHRDVQTTNYLEENKPNEKLNDEDIIKHVVKKEEKNSLIKVEESDAEDSKSDDLPLITSKQVDIPTEKTNVEHDLQNSGSNKDTIETIIIPDTPTPKKRTAIKDRSDNTASKKLRTQKVLTTDIKDNKKSQETSDDDDVRYMLNPDHKFSTLEEKFMKVRAEKRNSLQIERPNSKELIKRRISLQNPPKIPRLKAKPVETKVMHPTTFTKKPKHTALEAIASTDSDDSEIKYSFPESPVGKTDTKIVEKIKKKPLPLKRKSVTGVAKRKSLGKQKLTSPVKISRKRAEVEHRCDCGQLFSSAALLSRHTTLAHTPPRIRKRRSPPPDVKPQRALPPKSTLKQSNPAQSKAAQQKPQKSDIKKVSVRKSNNSDVKATEETKSNSNANVRRRQPNRGMLPENVRKINNNK